MGEQNFYCWGVHQYRCSLLSWHNNVLFLTNLTTGQIIILCHRPNLWMGKSFRGSKSTFHLWELLVHVLLGSQMDAGGVAFKSVDSGRNTCFSIRHRMMPLFLALKQTFCFVETNYTLFLTPWFPWETLSSAATATMASFPVRLTEQRPMAAYASSGYFSAFQLWHGKKMSCQISALYTKLCPSHQSVEGKDACIILSYKNIP